MAKVATKTTQRQRCPIKVKSSNGVQNNCLAATVSNKIVLSPIRRTNEEDDCYTKLLFSFIVQKTSGKPSMRYTFVARYTFIAHCNLRTPFTSSSNQTPCFILYTVHSSMLYSTKIFFICIYIVIWFDWSWVQKLTWNPTESFGGLSVSACR